MTSSRTSEVNRDPADEDRLAAVKRWAEYVRAHDDADWSRQQNTLIDSQLQSANELAAAGETNPGEFFAKVDSSRTFPR